VNTVPRLLVALAAILILLVRAQRIGSAEADGTPSKYAIDAIRIEPKDFVDGALRRRLESRADFEFRATPLGEVLNQLRARFQIEIEVEPEALAEEKVTLQTPITFSARGIRLRNAVTWILDRVHLEHVITKGRLVVDGNCHFYCTTRIYPVADLVVMPKAEPKDWVKFRPLHLLLISNILENAAFDNQAVWGPLSELMSIRTIDVFSCLVFTSPPRIHDRIDRILTGLREARSRLEQILEADGLAEEHRPWLFEPRKPR
jgi:hypothetical protein